MLHNVHRHSGGHCAKRQGHQEVGLIEGMIFHVVGKFEGVWLRLSEDVVCFAPPSPLFLLLCVIIRKCCKRITLVTLATIAHIFAGVYLTCLSSCSCSFCHIFTGKSFVFVCATCGEAIGTCVHRCIPYGTTLHTVSNIAQIFGGR